MRRLSSIMTLTLVVCLLTVGGASAAWDYAVGGIGDIFTDTFSVLMSEWDFSYTVTFKNNNQDILVDILKEDPLTWEQGTALDLTANDKAKRAGAQAAADMNELNDGHTYEFSHWVNAGSTRVDTISADNTEDITLYPSFAGVYTAKFVDQSGNVLDWFTFSSNTTSLPATPEVPTIDGFDFNDQWEIHVTNDVGETTDTMDYTLANLKSCECDVTIYPIYTYAGDVNLIPVDNDGDGETDEYQVAGYSDASGQDLVEIPNYVNGKPVTTVNANAFSSYAGVHVVVLPKEVEFVGDNAISDATVGGLFGSSKGETITLYYSGSKADWLEREQSFDDKWDYGISASSKIYFLGDDGKVDPTQGYLQANPQKTSGLNQYQTGVVWEEHTIDQSYIDTMYTKTCDCNEGDHDYGIDAVYDRIPDYIYWGEEDGSAAISAN